LLEITITWSAICEFLSIQPHDDNKKRNTVTEELFLRGKLYGLTFAPISPYSKYLLYSKDPAMHLWRYVGFSNERRLKAKEFPSTLNSNSGDDFIPRLKLMKCLVDGNIRLSARF
jgi:hypothetical protein